MTYIGRKWDGAVGGRMRVLLAVSNGSVRGTSQPTVGDGSCLIYNRLQVLPHSSELRFFLQSPLGTLVPPEPQGKEEPLSFPSSQNRFALLS